MDERKQGYFIEHVLVVLSSTTLSVVMSDAKMALSACGKVRLDM